MYDKIPPVSGGCKQGYTMSLNYVGASSDGLSQRSRFWGDDANNDISKVRL